MISFHFQFMSLISNTKVENLNKISYYQISFFNGTGKATKPSIKRYRRQDNIHDENISIISTLTESM